jgi:predicted Zn-dependent peptidase
MSPKRLTGDVLRCRRQIMRLHRYALVSVMLCGLQGFFPLFGSTSAAQVGVGVSIERFVLPNGLRLIVHENHDLPLAHVRMFYDVAEKDAGPGQTAHAHLFEHLAFSRTEHLDRSIWSFLKAIGARDYDANSQYDYTHYYATVPVAVLDTVLWMEAQRMAHLASALTEKDLERRRRIEGVLPGTRIRLVWNTPGWGTAAADYLELATTIMTGRVRSRLRGKGLATEVNGGTEMRGLGGQVMLDVLSSSPAGFPEIEQIIGEEIGRLASKGPTEGELDHAREEYRGDLGRDAAKLAGVTLLLGIGELLWRDPGHLQVMLERTERATAEDVRSAVDAWLTRGAFVLEFTPAR